MQYLGAMFRTAGVLGVALILSCGSGGPEQSPFFLWDIRPGMPLDSVAEFLAVHDDIRPDQEIWERCAPVGDARRCVRRNVTPGGELAVVVDADNRVLYMSFAPEPRSVGFDDSLSAMQRRWARGEDVKMDPHGISEQSPVGIAEMRSGRWRALMTFDGKPCVNTNRPCPALIQLVDWSAGKQYADMSVPPRP